MGCNGGTLWQYLFSFFRQGARRGYPAARGEGIELADDQVTPPATKGVPPIETSTPPSGGEASVLKKEVGVFSLGESLAVVPAKLVKRILKGEFVEMSELLKDNVEASGAEGWMGNHHRLTSLNELVGGRSPIS